jgi:hypothetical protein
MNAAVLHGLDAGGDFDELARCGFRVGEGRSAVSFMQGSGGAQFERGRLG